MNPRLALPRPAENCRLTVTIPARNEAGLIGRTLNALAAQRDAAGAPFEPGFFDVVVFVNNSHDATADIARAFARANPQLSLTTLEGELPAGHAHVGMARKLVMDAAAARFLETGRPDGLVVATDADTTPEPDWLAQTVVEARTVDAVASHVTLGESELASLLAPVRLLYARERAYRHAFAATQAALDPQPFDPWPRHASFVGAGFAVTAAAYAAAGGVPAIPVLEDRGFFLALRRIDARVRHSRAVRATTSARRVARASGGFGTFIDGLHAHGRAGESFSVDDPRDTLAEFEGSAALRRIRNGAERPGDRAAVERLAGSPAAAWLPLVDPRQPFGVVYDAIAALGRATLHAPVPVEIATASLQAALRAANAAAPMRSRAASGAG